MSASELTVSNLFPWLPASKKLMVYKVHPDSFGTTKVDARVHKRIRKPGAPDTPVRTAF
jgi:hypothetical protein